MLKSLKHEKQQKYNELVKRIEREQKLHVTAQKMEVKQTILVR